jgi:iron complex outermembrane receptor protein
MRISEFIKRICLLCSLIIMASIHIANCQDIPKDTISFRSGKSAELVNIGYGSLNRRELTYSIGNLNSVQFNKGNINNPLQLIQGKVAGLDITKPGGDPNGSFYLRLRGLSTINCNTQPLIVIDGTIEGSLDNVDPNDIEEITVLKDGSAAAIFGTRGSNGVLLVTTKKGMNGSAVIAYNVYTTAEMVARNTPVMNASQWRAMSAETGLGTDFGQNTDWFKEIERTALSQVHNLSMSGGTDKTSYRASVNFRQGEGVEIKTGYSQLNGRINLTQKALNDKFTLDLNLGATERESRYGFNEAFRYATIFNPTAPVRSDDEEYAKYDGYFQQQLFDYYNPVSIMELNTHEGKNRILNLSVKGTFNVVRGVSLDAFYSVQSTGNLEGKYLDKNDYWAGIYRNGIASRQQDNSASRLFESTIHYTGNISSSLMLTALGGYSYQDFTNEGFYAEGGDFLTDSFTFNNLGAALDFKNGKGTITSYKNSNKLIAFFGRLNLNISNIWFVSASARYEGSSRFGSDHKWGLFPSIGTGVDLSKVINISSLDYFKLRMDYGITGNQPGKSYLSLEQMDHTYGNSYYNGVFNPGYSIANNANPGLKWEKNSEFNTGFDFSFLQNRLSGSFDFYARTTTDLLWQDNVPVPPNLYYQVWLNLGKLQSRGLELTINYNIIKKPDFTYSISLSRSRNLNNKLVSLSGDYNGTSLPYGINYIGDLGSPGGCCVTLVRSEEGKPIGQLQAYVFKEIDENGQMILADRNGDNQINWTDLAVVGNGQPLSLIGLDNELTYKNWDLNIFIRGVFGHDLVNSNRAMYEVPNYISSYNLPESTVNMRNSTTGTLLRNSSGVVSSIDIENASFISLDNITLGYNIRLPESSQFSKIRMYLGGNNLFYVTGYKGSDPNPRYSDNEYGIYNSLIPGIDRRNTWPRTRSVTVGANIVF